MLGVPDQPGRRLRILGPIADANIEVDMIVQNIGQDGDHDFTFTVHRNDYAAALDILSGTAAELRRAQVLRRRPHRQDLAGRRRDALPRRDRQPRCSTRWPREGINIRMISTSEIKISVVVDEKYLELGVRALHEAFGLATSCRFEKTIVCVAMPARRGCLRRTRAVGSMG